MIQIIIYIYEIQKEYSKSLNNLDKLLSINKDDSLVLCYYGEILLSQKKYDKAITYFTKANNVDPENIHILFKRAITYNYLGKNDEALLDSINKELNINRNDSLVLCYYGEILFNLKRYGEAITYFTKANNIDPENIHILFKRAITYNYFGKNDEALLDINKALNINKEDSLVLYYYGE